MTVLHVATTGSDLADGSAQSPLRTVNRAAALAHPGDTVRVHAGEYREWVVPVRGGLSDRRRITYEAAPGEHVVLKGSEVVTGWRPDGGDVWRVDVPNALFGDSNPFAQTVDGDWLVHDTPDAPRKHLGDVYLDGRSLDEVTARADLDTLAERTNVVDHWTGVTVPVPHPERTRRAWYAEVGPDVTTIWATFDGVDPNGALTEINVRRSVFFPREHHLDYITVRGFEMAHAATPWAPPTADQPGLVGPNWAKGWIIEDNVIHDAKCSAISLGKEASTGDNWATTRGDKPGYQYQLESVFAARRIGWDREHVGSHVVRRNHVYDCGQNAVVGHLGCAFSVIEDNHVHDIATRREFFGHEIAGIKLHAAIDVVIRRNRVHGCTLGIWLDWQTQGTRVTRNLLYGNQRDLFVEVSHGPYVVDHNVLASPAALEVVCQGGAYVHNLVAGSVRLEAVPDRATPYHLPHSTQLAGFATVQGGDDRYVGNLFLGGDLDAAYAPGSKHHGQSSFGTGGYHAFPASFAEYLGRIDPTLGDHERFHGKPMPVYVRHNVYAGGARGYVHERDGLTLPADAVARVHVDDRGDEVHLEITLPDDVERSAVPALDGTDLEPARYAGAEFEDADGAPVRFDVDLVGTPRDRGVAAPAGPLVYLRGGTTRVRVW
ncbi:right-handed parallel beta-helix repeat-containing protein [Cellulomonas sp. HD19AZ1]|uniref:right-handed parallel beta-helix repeat-containing protein n=1 Tax=Cellulomonas TaxID=1707 RepID=UPI001070CDC6|nr:right-handed parallel beta-helix repeat-containing protein [Cellulomonas sp. HD19AZ1]TFH69455.1 DUF1565 domain-containing protein [Cellulomonas sp. HD19AZ1]